MNFVNKCGGYEIARSAVTLAAVLADARGGKCFQLPEGDSSDLSCASTKRRSSIATARTERDLGGE